MGSRRCEPQNQASRKVFLPVELRATSNGESHVQVKALGRPPLRCWRSLIGYRCSSMSFAQWDAVQPAYWCACGGGASRPSWPARPIRSLRAKPVTMMVVTRAALPVSTPTHARQSIGIEHWSDDLRPMRRRRDTAACRVHVNRIDVCRVDFAWSKVTLVGREASKQ